MTVVIEEKKEIELANGADKPNSVLGTLDCPTPATSKPNTACDGLDSSKLPPNTTPSLIFRASMDIDSNMHSPKQSQATQIRDSLPDFERNIKTA